MKDIPLCSPVLNSSLTTSQWSGLIMLNEWWLCFLPAGSWKPGSQSTWVSDMVKSSIVILRFPQLKCCLFGNQTSNPADARVVGSDRKCETTPAFILGFWTHVFILPVGDKALCNGLWYTASRRMASCPHRVLFLSWWLSRAFTDSSKLAA